MRKKSDVDLKDFQERKNLQDFIYETNQKLQGLSHGMTAMSLHLERVNAKSESDRNALLIAVENFKESVSLQCHKLSQRIGDIETKQMVHADVVNIKIDRLSAQSVDKQAFSASSSIHTDLCKDNTKAIYRHRDYVEIAFQEVRARQTETIELLRTQLISLINKEDPFKSEIADQVKSFREDFESLKKETTDLKLAFGCVQKKFECVARAERQKEGKK